MNTAIIAGNAPENRVDALRGFWDSICRPRDWESNFGAWALPGLGMHDLARKWASMWAAGRALTEGQPGFFAPRFPLPLAGFGKQVPSAVSYYDTAALKATLQKFADFDRINDGDIRVSVGAVNVRTGNLCYFDNTKMHLEPEHFMASGALPPGFPAVVQEMIQVQRDKIVARTSVRASHPDPTDVGRATMTEGGDSKTGGGFIVNPCRFRERCAGSCPLLTLDLADPSEMTDLSCIRSFRRRDAIVFLALTAVITVLCFAGAYRYFLARGMDDLNATAEQSLALHTKRLEQEITRFGVLPLAVSMNRDVIDYLKGDRSPARDKALTRILQSINASAGTSQTYVIDATGRAVASSNRGLADSFIGRDLSYRPYVQDARAGHVQGYYAVGTTTNTAGYYLASAVEEAGRRLGTVATKIELDRFERSWLGGAGRQVAVIDDNGVIVLSSRADWKYHVIGKLSAQQQHRIDDTQQYNRAALVPLIWRSITTPFEDRSLLKAGLPGQACDYLTVLAIVPSLSMRLMVLVDPTDVQRLALAEAGMVAIVAALIALGMYIIREKRLASQEQRLAGEALQATYRRLKARFERRSAQLRVANDGLKREVAERIESERRLRNYQDELLRTENLAVIGQLSAGLAHELNQPLAAMATLSENAVRFLQRGDVNTVQFNLSRICDLVTRMGTLTGRLRSFARRSDGEVTAVPLGPSIESAITLLGHRLKKDRVEVRTIAPQEPLRALCIAVRLEQVLVNLLSNAIEAMEGTASPWIEIRSGLAGDRAVIEVADNGIGLSETVQRKLFEPFFTTRKANGLGLGLAISANIISSFGGNLCAENGPQGGALFRITLKADIG
jgi:two-component system C4-dicarboxylate transport sensor histidine kinase DctB